MVPLQLRSRIMELAHGSIMGGHMGIKKTTDKIQRLSAFYWPARRHTYSTLTCASGSID